jgi:hypothetical protein
MASLQKSGVKSMTNFRNWEISLDSAAAADRGHALGRSYSGGGGRPRRIFVVAE